MKSSAGNSLVYMVGILAVLAIIVVATPFVTSELQKPTALPSTATEKVTVQDISVEKVSPNSYQITVIVSAPATGYLTYTDTERGTTKTILSVYGGDLREIQQFDITNTGAQGGTATIMLNGMASNPNGTPITISP